MATAVSNSAISPPSTKTRKSNILLLLGPSRPNSVQFPKNSLSRAAAAVRCSASSRSLVSAANTDTDTDTDTASGAYYPPSSSSSYVDADEESSAPILTNRSNDNLDECRGRRFHPPKWNALQRAAAAALDAAEGALISGLLERPRPLPKTADPAVQICGNFAPVGEQPPRRDLPVAGRIPPS
uniref:Uncharacterized protein n=1 Tax=Ananas comosus var. bracteatus TaxID=296719 RepID=A0A6V7NM65_ANACO|nr:unnamed protein product [Ananas comosus var. bracteatus]